MTEGTAKVFCPYCGMLMRKYNNGYGACWYECNCGATTPIVDEEEARPVALNYHSRADIDAICELKDRVENLSLYLQEAFSLYPDELAVLDEWHPGLPGYAPEPEEACAACRVEGNA